MSILDRLLRGGRTPSRPVGEAMERILRLSPQLRLARRCQARLEPAMEIALKYANEIVAAVPAAREVSAAVWNSDPYIHAFFAAPDDIARVLSRSADLRGFFEKNPSMPEAYAVLGMAMSSRHRLGVALEGETLRRDVLQETISFSDHQVRMCGRTEAELREEIVRRLVDQLGLEGLTVIAADKTRRDTLEQEQALLKTRLRLLESQGVGVRSVLGGALIVESQELERVQEEIEENERNLRDLGIRSEALERELDQLCELLANPSPHLYIESKRLRLDRMNVVLPENGAQSEQLIFRLARIPTTPPQVRAFALVRFARTELLPAISMLDEAARLLR